MALGLDSRVTGWRLTISPCKSSLSRLLLLCLSISFYFALFLIFFRILFPISVSIFSCIFRLLLNSLFPFFSSLESRLTKGSYGACVQWLQLPRLNNSGGLYLKILSKQWYHYRTCIPPQHLLPPGFTPQSFCHNICESVKMQQTKTKVCHVEWLHYG